VAQLTANDRAALADLGPQYAQHFTLHRGWFRGAPIQYFDIGPQENTSAAVFLFITGIAADGTPQLVPGQRPVFSSIPGLAAFSGEEPRFFRAQANIVDVVPGAGGTHDLWDVTFVQVPPGYEPDGIRDLPTLLRRSDFTIRRAGQVRNCPVVLLNGARAPR